MDKEISDDDLPIKNLEELKSTRLEFHYRNILPIPHLLTKAYLSLEVFDPQSVAQAFYSPLMEFNTNPSVVQHESHSPPDLHDDEKQPDSSSSHSTNEDQNLSTSHNSVEGNIR